MIARLQRNERLPAKLRVAAKPQLISIERALADRQLLGAALGDLSTWTVWVSVLKAAYGLRLTTTERKAFDEVAGGRKPPTRKVKELSVKASRRSGKGRMVAATAVYEALLVDHSALAPGEVGVIACISPTVAQAKIVLDYVVGFLQASPLLRDQVAEITADEVRLTNGVVITTLANNFRSLRGRTLLLAILDEAAFLRSENSAYPDIEAARALRPGLATTGGMLIVVSSPYRRSGLLYQRQRDFYGKDSGRVLAVAGPSLVFNPTLDTTVIDADTADDPHAALSEWHGQERPDLAAFLDETDIERAIDYTRPTELPYVPGKHFAAGCDMAGGRGDASVLCIGHSEGEGESVRFIADVVRACTGPHDPAAAVREFAALLREYHINEVGGDNYSAEWVSGAFTDAGIAYRRFELNRSALYLASLPLFLRGCVSIPNQTALTRELRCLERRTGRSGKDTVDHGPSGSDDHANALFGMLNRLSAGSPADQWVRWSAKEAERASDIPEAADDADHSTRQTAFYLRGNPKYGTSAPPANNVEQQPNTGSEPRHPWQPAALVNNSYSSAYFSALSKAENRVNNSLQVPRCCSCGRETIGSRLSDGARVWCDAGCHQRYAAAIAEKNKARDIAVNGGLPLSR